MKDRPTGRFFDSLLGRYPYNYDLSDGVYEGVDREKSTTDYDTDKAGHDDHKDRFDHCRNVVNLFVEFGFVDLGGFS